MPYGGSPSKHIDGQPIRRTATYFGGPGQAAPAWVLLLDSSHKGLIAQVCAAPAATGKGVACGYVLSRASSTRL